MQSQKIHQINVYYVILLLLTPFLFLNSVEKNNNFYVSVEYGLAFISQAFTFKPYAWENWNYSEFILCNKSRTSKCTSANHLPT